MTFAYTGGATNTGSSASASTGVHGIAINSGDLVVVYVNSNSATAISADAGGAAFTEAVDETPASETAQQALYWKVAGGSEPTSYTFTVGNAGWHVCIKVFTSATNAEVDLTPVTDRTGSNSTTLSIATDARTPADDAVSIVCGGKDTRDAGAEAYTSVTGSYVSVLGDVSEQATGMAHRIWTTGAADTDPVVISTTDGNDGLSDRTYSIHMSFVEGAAPSGRIMSSLANGGGLAGPGGIAGHGGGLAG